mgnify:CR=1 FL=1
MANYIDVPDSTESLHNIGEWIMQYDARQNAFLNALVNRIGRVLVTSKMWNNPWTPFKKGMLEMGETVEEIFVNLGKVYSFDPADAENTLFKREIPDVRAAFHTMNYQKLYPVTISNDQLRQAFLSWEGITDLIAKIVDTLYTGMRYDEYITMKYMICREALNGGFYVEQIAGTDTADNLKKFIAKTREVSNDLEFLSTKYNKARVYNSTPKAEQYIIMDNAVESRVDVDVLAVAFNMDKSDFIGHLMKIDHFDQHDKERLDMLFANDTAYTFFTSNELTTLGKIGAILLDKDWWMVFDNFEQFTQNYNGKGLYWQYFFHAWKTFSVSPYANAVCFYGDTTSVTTVTVTPGTATMTAGTAMQMTATVAGTGLYDDAVVWSISGQTASGTNINKNNGLLYVASDEPSDAEIVVTATAVNGVSGTGTITVA